MGPSVVNKLNLLERYNKLKPREKIFIFAAFIVGFLFMADFVLVRPIWDYHISLNEQIGVLERQLVRNLLNINRKSLVEGKFEKYRQWIHPVSSDEEEIGKMLSEIEQNARSNKVALVDMKPRQTKTLDFYKEYRTELDAEMPMKNWVQFVYQIENSDQLILLSTLKLNYKKEPEPAVVKAKMEFTKTLLLEKK